MADHFADQYWSTKFWTVNYFQGGEQDPNAMSAALSGAGALSAAATGLGFMAASLSGAGDIAGDLQPAAEGDISASLSGSGSITAALTYTGTAAVGRSKLHTPIFQNLYNPQAERQAALAQAIKREDEEILMAIKEFLKVAA